MELPAGTQVGVITDPQEEGAIQQLIAFRGVIEIDTQLGHGFILTDHSVLIAAYFRDSDGSSAFLVRSAESCLYPPET